MDAEQLFEKALAQVESVGARKWATTEQNRPIWVKIAQSYLNKNPAAQPSELTTYINCTYIGL